MIRYARRLALGAACLLLVGCSSTTNGETVPGGTRAADPRASGSSEEPTTSGGKADPTARIKGVLSLKYKAGQHVKSPQRVAYDHTPPLGGPHDQLWAPCNGVVYKKAVRTENVVHSLEHGAVWLTYDPKKVKDADLATLVKKVDGQPYSVLSPYPGQPTAVSVQAWGRQVQVDGVDDPRIDQFITATRGNPDLAPEAGARCDEADPEAFSQDNPPPFDPTPPGPDAVPVGGGS
ncbi:DUF3105 domain-containing protein [Actinokineospora auranticolor]|uniref:Uncharacterized protein DUF3105 n=1 Tax=Actinokineospora auranticolor TaxID=155976 RepID=A0A2S6GHT8_9PSEU|nr:DUF3105 domain-containing protein [Actinokineospora auranticolor]PPK64794.1 uncharacterized protein DUF3105 [Actinokineospora auranticolor]